MSDRQVCPRCEGRKVTVLRPYAPSPCSTCLGVGSISPSHWAYVHTNTTTTQEEAA